MTEYRYIFGTLGDERVIEEISLYGVYMSMELNAGGTFNGTFNLDRNGKTNQDLVDATIPGRTFVCVERDNVPIWFGAVWSSTYQSQSKSVQLFAQSLEVFPQSQVIESNFILTGEQRNIFRTLWTTMQGVAGRNINVDVPSAFDTQVTKSLDIKSYEYKTFGTAMAELADADDGFDWYIEVVRDGVGYQKTLQIGYPTLGSLSTEAQLIFEYPGAILNYFQTQSMGDSGTNIFVLGAGEGSGMLVATTTQQRLLDSGWPRWDRVVSRKDISNQEILNGIANQQKVVRQPPMTIIKTQVHAGQDPEFGSYRLGDTCRVVIKDARNPSGLDFQTRLIKWELTPQSEGNIEEVQLTFQESEFQDWGA